MPNFNWWPRHDTTEWVQYDFPKEEQISSSQVYWFQDVPDGDCMLPVSWTILYRSGDTWVPVKNTVAYETAKDKLCKVAFEPVTTSAVRLKVVLPKEHSSGLYKWLID